MSETPHQAAVLLIVESATAVKHITKHLKEYFTIQVASDDEAAWESIQTNNDVDVIVCDLRQAVGSFGLLERLRDAGDKKLAATPVLLLVGENDTENDREIAFSKGATDFINLPFASAELIARVRLHANIYAQHLSEPCVEMQSVSAVNVLQQLSQEKYFESRVLQEIAFSLRHRSSLSLAKLSLDNMSAIAAGFDQSTVASIVQAVAKIIKETRRREDSLCYFGKGEFCILYPATNGIGATDAVKRIARNVASSKLRVAGKKIRVTLSAAIYSWIASGETDLDAIYQVLDESLRQAIAEGGNRVSNTTTDDEKRIHSIDRALRLIEMGKTEDLAAHAQPLLHSVLPLLEFVDGELELDVTPLIDRLRVGEQAQS